MRKITSLIIILLLVFRCAAAASVVSEGYSGGRYRLSGVANGSTEPVKIEILNSGYTFDDVKNVTADNVNDIYFYAGQIYSNEDKTFEFDIPAGSDKGNFCVKVSFFNGQSVYKTYCTFTEEDVKNAIESVAKSENINNAEIDLIIKNYYPALGIDLNDYSKSLTADEKDKLLSFLAQKISDDTTPQSFSNDANGYICFLLASKGTDTDTFARYEKYISLSSANYYEDFKKLENSEKQAVINSLKGASSPSEAEKSLENAVIITVLKNTVWSKMRDELEFYKDNLSLDLKKADNLDEENQKNVYVDLKAMLENGEITDISKISENLESLVSKYTPERVSGGGSGGSGGGKKSGGTSFTSFVEVKDDDEPKLAFDDIEDTEWAVVPIVKLSQMGIVKGKSERVFDPGAYVTREEFVSLIVRAFNIENGEAFEFEDVENDRWSASAIYAARKNDIVGGISDSLFAPEEKITRQDMAVMIYRTSLLKTGESGGDISLPFSDKDDIAPYAAQAVSNLSRDKIINGTGNGFEPYGFATRAQAAAVIYRLMQKLGL